MTFLFSEYSAFTQKFIELWDEYAGIMGEIEECREDGAAVPDDTMAEKNAYAAAIETMIADGWNRWNKTPAELRQDGWNYFFSEDKILREMRYGK